MLHAIRASRVGARLLIGSVALVGATAGSFDADAHSSRVAAALHSSQTRCAATAHHRKRQTRAGRRGVEKSCVVKKSKKRATRRRALGRTIPRQPASTSTPALEPYVSVTPGLSVPPSGPNGQRDSGDPPPTEDGPGDTTPIEEGLITAPSEEESIASPSEEGSSSGSPTESPPEQIGKPDPSLTSPFRFFSPSSFWNQALSAQASLDPNSTSVVDAFDQVVAAERTAGTGPWIGTTEYSVPIYTVPASQPTVPIALEHTPAEATLSAAWSVVPLPTKAKPATGHDGNLVVWQPSTERLWEFWKLVHGWEGWRASWGGAISNVSSSGGVFGSGAWPGAKPWWGVSASSLSIAGGLITFEDLEHGKIEHALAMAIPGVRAGVYSSPAQRTDGKSTNPLALPEGAHLRLNPSLDLATLHLPKLTLMIAEAAQRYGIFVRDGAGNVQLFAQDPSSLSTNPYTGPEGYFEGKRPARLLASFPWQELQLLKMELHNAK
jgi:hypothetical protein